jgi:hypothetical protein
MVKYISILLVVLAAVFAPERAHAITMQDAMGVCEQSLSQLDADYADPSRGHHYECQVSTVYPNCYAVMGYYTDLQTGNPVTGWGEIQQPAAWEGVAACWVPGGNTCQDGDSHGGPFIAGTQFWGNNSVQCRNGCEAHFHSKAGGSVSVCGTHGKCLQDGDLVDDGNSCTDDPGGGPQPPTTDPPMVCDPTTGVCMTPTGPQFCANNGAGPCTPANSCGSGSGDTLCASPPNGNPPTPPTPPVPPGQPPISVTNFTSSTGPVTNNNTVTNHKDPPATTTPGTCADGSTPGSGGTCSNGDHSQCGGAPQNPDGSCNGGTAGGGSGVPITHPGTCAGGGSPDPSTGKCPDFSPPTCSDGSTPNANGQCAGTNPNPGGPSTCGGSGHVVGGSCYCPSGTTFNGTNCVGVGGGTSTGTGGGNGNPQNPGNGTCDGPSPPPSCKDNASGGGDCGAPPACTGDTVACNIDYQAWAARCQSSGKVVDDSFTDLYTKSTDTTSSVMDQYAQSVTAQSATITTAAAHFFTLNVSGSCPHFTIPVVDEWAHLDGGFLCNGTLDSILQLVGYVVLAAAAYKAFQIALY